MTDDEMLSRYFETGLEHDLQEHLLREEHRLVEALEHVPQASKLPVSVKASVMARVRAEPNPAWRRALQWFVSPKALRVSPLGALGFAVLIAFAFLFRPSVPAAVTATRGIPTRFIFEAPEAAAVAITGDFAAWSRDGVPLRRQPDGTWMGEIRLEPGVHRYTFVVDGAKWMPDPRALWSENDGFGGRNSLTIIPAAAGL